MSRTNILQTTTRPDDVRRLVFDYLCNNCYASTAFVFARESTPRELDRDGDEIPSEGKFGSDSNLLDPTMFRFARRRKEQSRTLPLPCPNNIPVWVQSTPSNPQLVNSAYEEERKRRLLALVEELYSLVYALPDTKDRNLYIDELNCVGGLLAYPVPEKCRQMRKYLDKARREAVADQINEAILSALYGPETVPAIVELMTRQTTVLFSTLNSLRLPLPATEQRPAGLDSFLSPKPATTVQEMKTLEGNKDKENYEIVPIFELDALLGTKV
ncbi:hypothetical protein Clacol_005785 [Clathrus columnatus]|uniref:CTLH/CRA C-terminal to LisH motif domain-containing protein n=1 Tax=Clathrus columnatus TaxID=1419009 RepID=A0AAV5AA97_9AGAM|nr:hypothetical protein Clacol_005785 [Clathrus columnatus]